MPLSLPSEIPLLRATMDHPLYTIHIVESGNDRDVDTALGSFPADRIFVELKELYKVFNIHGGFEFPTESIAMRMKSMDHVLCWFGFRDSHKYTCYIQNQSTS